MHIVFLKDLISANFQIVYSQMFCLGGCSFVASLGSVILFLVDRKLVYLGFEHIRCLCVNHMHIFHHHLLIRNVEIAKVLS